MDLPTTPASTIGPDPWVRSLVPLLLRAGLGIHLLNGGLIHYMATTMGVPSVGVISLVPYLEIALGIALIAGMFTTAAAVATGLLMVLQPLVQTLALLGGGPTQMARGPFGIQAIFDSIGMSHLLLSVAVLWLSSPGRNPWSLDALIFGRQGARPGHSPVSAFATATSSASSKRVEAAEPAPAPAPGERTARFLADREG